MFFDTPIYIISSTYIQLLDSTYFSFSWLHDNNSWEFFFIIIIFFCFSLHVLINAAPLAFDVMENDEIRFYKNNTYMHITIAAAATSSPPQFR